MSKIDNKKPIMRIFFENQCKFKIKTYLEEMEQTFLHQKFNSPRNLKKIKYTQNNMNI